MRGRRRGRRMIRLVWACKEWLEEGKLPGEEL